MTKKRASPSQTMPTSAADPQPASTDRYTDALRSGAVAGPGVVDGADDRRQLEQALRDTLFDYKRAQILAKVGCWRFDVSTNGIAWSDENYLIFGVPFGTDITFERFLAIVHPRDRSFVAKAWMAALGGEPYDIEHRIIVGDEVKWVREFAELEFDRDGSLRGGFGITQDITDRKAAEEALARKERYQRALLDNFPFMVWLKDTESRFLAVNDTFAKAFGAESAEMLVGKTDFDILAAEAASGYRATDLEVLASRRQVSVEEVITTTASSNWFETYKAPVFDDHGGLLGTVGFAREITERKEAEARLLRAKESLEEQVADSTAEARARTRALLESERLFRETIDALPSILCVLDENGRIIAVNKAWRDFARHNGIDPEGVSEGANYLAVCDEAARCAPDTAAVVASAIRELLAGKRKTLALKYECSSPTKERWFEMTVSRFSCDGPMRLVVVHNDITESKRLAEEQRETAAQLQRLAAHRESVREEQSAVIAREIHDELGGTLTMLKLGLATTMDDLASSGPMFERLRSILNHADSALKTVKRISSNLRPAMLDTLGLVATIKWHAEQFSRLTGIAVELSLPEYIRLSAGAAMGVFRIIQEGLTNVAKHSGGSKVSITLLKHKGNLIVRIRDNGKGLPEASVRKHDSVGVIGMLERALHLGGELSLTGSPQTGTQLILRIPLDVHPTFATRRVN